MSTPSSYRLAAALLLLPLAVPCQAVAKDPLDAVVTVRVKDAPVALFLDSVSAQSKVNFILTEGFEKERFTAFLDRMTVRQALDALCEAKGLSVRRLGRSSTYLVRRKGAMEDDRPRIVGEGMPEDVVNVAVRNAPLSVFLDTLSAQAKVSFTMADGLDRLRLTAFLKHVTMREALELVLELKHLTCTKGASGAWLVAPDAKAS